MRSNSGKIFFLIIIFSLLLFSTKSRAEEKAIHVAYAGPVKGSDSASGRSLIQSIELYFDQINRQGGINGKKVVLDLYDDQNIPSVARQRAKEIVASSAVAVIGHWYSSCSLAVKDIYNNAKIPVLTFSSDVNVTLENDVFYRTVYNNGLQGRFLANYAVKILKKRSIVLLHGDQTYELGLKDIFLKSIHKLAADVKLVRQYKTGLSHDDPDWEALGKEIGQLKDSDLIFLSSQAPDAARLVKLIRDKDIKSAILGTGELSDSAFTGGFKHLPREISRRGSYTDGVYLASPLIFDTANAKAQAYKTIYEETYKEPASAWGAYAFDNAMLLVKSFRFAGITGKSSAKSIERKRVLTFLKTLNSPNFSIEGITGLNYFDKNGDSRKPIAIGQFRNGQIISAMTQLQGVRNLKDIYNLKEKMTRGSILYIDGDHMYRTSVVYTGIKVREVRELDINDFTCTVIFDLWFRMSTDFDTSDIIFTTADKTINLGQPVEENRQGKIIYRRYIAEGRFKLDFPGWQREFEEHVIGISFRHRNLSRKNLVFVVDLLGMGLRPNEKVSKRVMVPGVMNKASGWIPKYASCYQDIITIDSKGNPEHLNMPNALVEFSSFNIGIWLKTRGLSPRRTINSTTAWIITGFCFFLLLWLWFLSHDKYLDNKGVLFLAQAPAALIFLLGIEIIIIDKFSELSRQKEILDSIVRGFDILWWVVPAFLLNLAIKCYIFLQLERRSGRKVPDIIPPAVGFIVYLLAFFGIIAYVFDEKVTSLLATSGLAAMIIGLAVQINISNIFSGIIINIEHPFRIGDWVQIGNYEEGKILDITWRSTRILTRTGNILSIPNSQSAESVMRNYSFPYDKIWGQLVVHVDPGHFPERVLKILKDAVLSGSYILQEPAPRVLYMGLSEWSGNYMIFYCYDNYANKGKMEEEIWMRIWSHLNRAGISPAIQKSEIHMFQGREERGSIAKQPFIVLSEVDVFKAFSKEAITSLVGKIKQKSFARDRHVVQQGDYGDSLYMVVEGAVAVYVKTENGKKMEVARLGAGEVFGEMSLLTGESRSADVITITQSLFFEITKQDLMPILEKEPEAIQYLSEILAERKMKTEFQMKMLADGESDKKTMKQHLIGKIKKFFQIS
jgi:potassium-dependent mechanosensitive channel